MSRMVKTSLLSAGLAIALGLAPLAGAADLSAQDRKFIEDAYKGGMMEVRMGQMALQHASSTAAKNLGQRLVDDHTKANNELMDLAKRKGVTLSGQDSEMPTQLNGKTGADFDREFGQI